MIRVTIGTRYNHRVGRLASSSNLDSANIEPLAVPANSCIWANRMQELSYCSVTIHEVDTSRAIAVWVPNKQPNASFSPGNHLLNHQAPGLIDSGEFPGCGHFRTIVLRADQGLLLELFSCFYRYDLIRNFIQIRVAHHFNQARPV